MNRVNLVVAAALCAATPALAQKAQPATSPAAPQARQWPRTEGDFRTRDFAFQSGKRLPELRIHYTTLGTPRRDGNGLITNAVMVLHGTGGTGKQFLAPQFAD